MLDLNKLKKDIANAPANICNGTKVQCLYIALVIVNEIVFKTPNGNKLARVEFDTQYMPEVKRLCKSIQTVCFVDTAKVIEYCRVLVKRCLDGYVISDVIYDDTTIINMFITEKDTDEDIEHYQLCLNVIGYDVIKDIRQTAMLSTHEKIGVGLVYENMVHSMESCLDGNTNIKPHQLATLRRISAWVIDVYGRLTTGNLKRIGILHMPIIEHLITACLADAKYPLAYEQKETRDANVAAVMQMLRDE